MDFSFFSNSKNNRLFEVRALASGNPNFLIISHKTFNCYHNDSFVFKTSFVISTF